QRSTATPCRPCRPDTATGGQQDAGPSPPASRRSCPGHPPTRCGGPASDPTHARRVAGATRCGGGAYSWGLLERVLPITLGRNGYVAETVAEVVRCLDGLVFALL